MQRIPDEIDVLYARVRYVALSSSQDPVPNDQFVLCELIPEDDVLEYRASGSGNDEDSGQEL